MKQIMPIEPEKKFDEVIKQIKPNAGSRFKLKLNRFKFGKETTKKIVLPAGAMVLLILLFVVMPLINVYSKSQFLTKLESRFRSAIEAQDIEILASEIDKTKAELTEFENAYSKLAWTQHLPYFGNYWRDGNRFITAAFSGIDAAQITLQTLSPYADIIGFTKGSVGAQSGQETAQDRMEFVVETLDAVLPRLGEITDKIEQVKSELGEVDVSKYPESIGKYKVRHMMQKVLDLVDKAADFVIETKPVIEKAKYLLGIDETRTYLVLFQNDKELRPTGGFITAYTIMQVDKGKVNSVVSSDIYALDDKYKPVIASPPQFAEFLKGPYILSPNLRLRDMNYLVDFKDSMDLFSKEVAKAGIKNVDGIIAVDTFTLVNILDVLGEIGVAGFGNYSTKLDPECACPQVVHELEKFADVEGPIVWSENEPGKIVFRPPNSENRKGIIGPLMNSVLANAMGQPKEKIPGLFEAIYKSVQEKHVLFYMFQEDVQKAVEDAKLAGRIGNTSEDYLHINDANLGGRKSNLYVKQEVTQDVELEKDGTILKTLTVTYANTQDYDGWLNSVLPNWTRIYVPDGSELVSSEGFDKTYETVHEYGKTVFSGSFKLRPQGIVKITLKYKVPIKVNGSYQIVIQKQPGTDKPFYTLNFGKKTTEFYLTTDTEVSL